MRNMSKFNTVEEYKAEIEKVKAISRNTHSEYLKRDYAKYIKRLKKELAYVRTKRQNQRA